MIKAEAQPSQESIHRRFTSIPVPPELLGKELRVVQRAFHNDSKYKDRLATIADLEHIKANPGLFKDLRDKNWHFALGSSIPTGSGVNAPYVRWVGDELYLSLRLIGSGMDGHDHVLLRD